MKESFHSLRFSLLYQLHDLLGFELRLLYLLVVLFVVLFLLFIVGSTKTDSLARYLALWPYLLLSSITTFFFTDFLLFVIARLNMLMMGLNTGTCISWIAKALLLIVSNACNWVSGIDIKLLAVLRTVLNFLNYLFYVRRLLAVGRCIAAWMCKRCWVVVQTGFPVFLWIGVDVLPCFWTYMRMQFGKRPFILGVFFKCCWGKKMIWAGCMRSCYSEECCYRFHVTSLGCGFIVHCLLVNVRAN